MSRFTMDKQELVDKASILEWRQNKTAAQRACPGSMDVGDASPYLDHAHFRLPAPIPGERRRVALPDAEARPLHRRSSSNTLRSGSALDRPPFAGGSRAGHFIVVPITLFRGPTRSDWLTHRKDGNRGDSVAGSRIRGRCRFLTETPRRAPRQEWHDQPCRSRSLPSAGRRQPAGA